LFQCPKETTAGQSDFKQSGYTDYFFNAQLQNRDMETIGDATHLIMAAEGNDGSENTDARYAKTAIPAAWRTDANSPSFRHLGTANYLFVDGHVKAFKVEQISTDWSATKLYFQPKR
jgi:prepilin-type processing-associated H-X9-DG protein